MVLDVRDAPIPQVIRALAQACQLRQHFLIAVRVEPVRRLVA